MISRRTLLGCAAVAGLTGTQALWAKEEKETFVLGKDYIALDPVVQYPKRPILIHDFFAYTCPHCYRLAPLMAEYAQSVEKDPDIRIIPVPVAWEESFEYFPAVYFAFEALGRVSDLHMSYWEWVMREDHPWSKVDDVKPDTDKWIAEHGISKTKWHATLESFVVKNKVKQATETWQRYNIDSTPIIGIAGRFITAPHMTGSRPKAIETMRMLVEKIKSERS